MTQAALDSIAGQVTQVPLSVVLVDNGSTDGSGERLASANPDVTVVRLAANGGFGAGVNAGLAVTDTDLVVLLNNDAIAEPDFVQNLVDAVDAGGDDVAAVTGRILLSGTWERESMNAPAGRRLVAADGTVWVASETGRILTNSTGNIIDAAGNGQDRSWLVPHKAEAATEVFGFSGGAALLRRSALEAVGPFDESLFMYYEDTELSWRLRRAGWRVVFAGDALVHHRHAGSSSVHSEMFIRYNTRNRLAVAMLHGPWWMVISAVGRTVGRVVRLRLRLMSRSRSTADALELRAAQWGLREFMADALRLAARRRAQTAVATVDRRRVLAETFVGDAS